MQFLSKAVFGLLIASSITSCGDRDSRYDTLDDTHSYRIDGAYSSVLKACATAETAIGSCSLNKLPPLGMEVSEPTIEDVMSRVLVSHDWMGERFEQLLEELPNDMLQLLGGVTVVVIDADIRPSYYHNVTGAIYLDPVNLWMTQEEKNVINRKEDHRAAYADPMSFRSTWRLVKDNDNAYRWFGLDSQVNRPFEDVVLPMASLLYHELAHANDIFPVSAYDAVDKSKSIYSITESLYNQYHSTTLLETHPLDSAEMYSIASILFMGATPSEDDTQISATQVGSYFSSDNASDDYAYSSQYEDLAMLVEETMMKFHFDVDRDIAFLHHNPDAEECDDNVIGWGVRNRIANGEVKKRAKLVLEHLLPAVDYSSDFEALTGPTPLPTNSGWCESITVGETNTAQSKLQIQNRRDQPLRPDHTRRPYGIHF